jgi:hypothetical protein
LKQAVVDAAQKEKALKHLNNFQEGWDLLRFIYLVDRLKGTDPFPNLKDVKLELKKYRDLRNKRGAHQDHCAPGGPGLDDDQLRLIISFSKANIPAINSLERTSADAAKIRTKLRKLRLCLYDNDE